MARETDKAKLDYWQSAYKRAEDAYSDKLARMDRREELYRGTNEAKALVKGEKQKKVPHVRNICAELIESQVNPSIPSPKVTPIREEDEAKAKLIEDMLRAELDRLPIEEINDIMERTVPIQGGGIFLCEWDNSERTHTTVGEICISALHPKQVIPQDGVFTGIEDMDYIFLKIPQTKDYIFRRYGKRVEDEGESDPDIKGLGESASDDLVTQIIAYYRNENGGIGLYSFVNDVVLEDIDDYQARRTRKCKKCGAPEPTDEQSEAMKINDDILIIEGSRETHGKVCSACGCSEFEESDDDFEEIFTPIELEGGRVIEGSHRVPIVNGEDVRIEEKPTRVPYYKPNIYPVILQKNVSLYGRFLGDSDIDKIEDQQNTINRLHKKMIDKIFKSGSAITLPPNADIRDDSEDMRTIRISKPSDKELIGVYNLEGNISQDMAYLSQIYEEAKQAVGVTDSFLGRVDRTATSGKAKEFSAAQAAGRMESKRVMKNAAYAKLFEAIFKFKLAYEDEPRPIVSRDIHGNDEYKIFNRYDFLEKDAAGKWYWNDRFLFSCDTTAPLASNREAMWQETRMNLQSGAFGNPQDIKTLIIFWAKMEQLHYPTAGETKRYLEEELKGQMQQNIIAQAEADAQKYIEADRSRRSADASLASGAEELSTEAINSVIAKAETDAKATLNAKQPVP